MSETRNRRRFSVVPRRRSTRWSMLAAAIVWGLSLFAVWSLATRNAAPTLAEVTAERDALREEHTRLSGSANALRQQVANLGRAEEVTRIANLDLQRNLAEREEEMAQLRADVSFYERLVGVSGQRRGLTVHSVQFADGGNGLWSFQVTLVQNLNRGKVSRGELRLELDGVRDGRLVSLDWPTLRQTGAAPPESFEFRYFQQLQGSVMLPKDFQPHRVKVQLRTEGRSQEQAFDWEQTLNGAASAGR